MPCLSNSSWDSCRYAGIIQYKSYVFSTKPLYSFQLDPMISRSYDLLISVRLIVPLLVVARTCGPTFF